MVLKCKVLSLSLWWDSSEGEVRVLIEWFLYVGERNRFALSIWGIKLGMWLPNTAVPYPTLTISCWISSLRHSFYGPSAMRLSFSASISQKWPSSFLTFSSLVSVIFFKTLCDLHFEFFFVKIFIFLCLSSTPFLY